MKLQQRGFFYSSILLSLVSLSGCGKLKDWTKGPITKSTFEALKVDSKLNISSHIYKISSDSNDQLSIEIKMPSAESEDAHRFIGFRLEAKYPTKIGDKTTASFDIVCGEG